MSDTLTPIERIERRKKHVTAACISNIFLHSQEERKKELRKVLNDFDRIGKFKEDYRERSLIYPNMVEIKQVNRVGSHVTKGKNEGKRGKITEFSTTSRRNFIKKFCMLTDNPELWQDFTFADDVMEGQSIEEKRDVSNKTLNRLRRHIKEEYPESWVIYKREWEPRKSGKLKGECIPHFHAFIGGINDDYLELAVNLAEKWVDYMGTAERQKALRVALHINSFRIIESQAQAMRYATKYVTKDNKLITDESIGRSWGTIGNVPFGDPLVIEMTHDEAVKLRRLFRKLVPKRHYLQKQLREQEVSTFVIVKQETVLRYLEYIRADHEQEVMTFFEGVS